jgi:hypothetical protein
MPVGLIPLLRDEHDVDPVVVGVVGVIREDVRAAIGINPVTADRGARRGGQQQVRMGVGKVVAVGDTSRNGILCTFAENRCNVINSLPGTAANEFWPGQKQRTLYLYLLITNGLDELTSP